MSKTESLIAPDTDYIDSSLSTESRSVMRSGNIEVAVDDIDKTLDEITDIRELYAATINDLSDYGKGKDRVVFLTIKVEEDKFESLYRSLKELQGEYKGSSIGESDVTDMVVDLEARLKNYRSVETQLQSILESAKTVEETLAVYKELNEVRYNIERTEAELKGIENQTKYSYITMNISQTKTGAEIVEEEWKPVGIFREALSALVNFAKFVGSGIIWLVVFVPVIVLIVGPVILIQKKRKK